MAELWSWPPQPSQIKRWPAAAERIAQGDVIAEAVQKAPIYGPETDQMDSVPEGTEIAKARHAAQMAIIDGVLHGQPPESMI